MYGPRYQRLLILLFMVALWSPLLLSVLGAPTVVSTAEKRKLAEFPKWADSSWKSFTSGLENYYNDHFGFRRSLIRWYNIVLVTWLGESNTRWALVGRDGWLFQSGEPHLKEMRNAWPFSESRLARWADVMTAKQRWLDEQGIDYLFVITPSKHLIYPDKLPRFIDRVSDTSRMDQLVTYLREHTQVPVLDLRPALMSVRGELRPYHKTDTHWNAFGAYVGYRELMKTLYSETAAYGVPDMGPDEFEKTPAAGGDLAQALDLRDVLTEMDVTPRTWQPGCAEYSGLDGDASLQRKNKNMFATRCAQASKRLLMFRDSFSLELMPYLSESFGYVYYVPHSPVSLSNIQRLVSEQRPDVVIEQRASRWLRTPQG